MYKLLLLVGLLAVVEANLPDYDSRIPHVVPEKVFNYLKRWQWGDYHVVFHASRKWYLMGDRGRQWLRSMGESQGAHLQEGDPENGIEFLCMHRAMINHLRRRWGSEKVTNAPGKRTFSDVLDGWKTDDEVIAALTKRRGDVGRFKRGLAVTNNFQGFASEDDFGNYLQTTLKLTGEVDPNDSARRYYDQDARPGAGVHNWLHGQFMENSPISVGDPSTNLANNMFWAIHGWIENKWKAFEKVHRRTNFERKLFAKMLNRFDLVLQLHSDFSDRPAAHMPSAPPAVVTDMEPAMFTNHVDCARLTPGTRTAECPEGRETRGRGRGRRN